MRRVRGGRVGGESVTGHGQGQTITRSIHQEIGENLINLYLAFSCI